MNNLDRLMSTDCLTAYDFHRHEADALLMHHRIVPRIDVVEDFQFGVLKSFHRGVHEAHKKVIQSALKQKFGSQQNIAAALGLTDRSSVSKIFHSETMDGIRITTALQLCPEMQLPSSEKAALSGFARATSHVKAVAWREPSLEGTLKPQKFRYLIGLLANDQWDAATRDTDLEKARALAQQIVAERTIARGDAVRKDHRRPEQLVLMLQNLWLSWSEFAILALWAIPECIPETKEH
jgi:hypothetical protein